MRTTEDDVKKIMDTDLEPEQLTPFLAMSNGYVTRMLTGVGLDDATLAQIEAAVAAHLACARDPQIESETVTTGQATYEKGDGLAGTRYGRMAMQLDTTGILSAAEAGGEGVFAYGGGHAGRRCGYVGRPWGYC